MSSSRWRPTRRHSPATQFVMVDAAAPLVCAGPSRPDDRRPADEGLPGGDRARRRRHRRLGEVHLRPEEDADATSVGVAVPGGHARGSDQGVIDAIAIDVAAGDGISREGVPVVAVDAGPPPVEDIQVDIGERRRTPDQDALPEASPLFSEKCVPISRSARPSRLASNVVIARPMPSFVDGSVGRACGTRSRGIGSTRWCWHPGRSIRPTRRCPSSAGG